MFLITFDHLNILNTKSFSANCKGFYYDFRKKVEFRSYYGNAIDYRGEYYLFFSNTDVDRLLLSVARLIQLTVVASAVEILPRS